MRKCRNCNYYKIGQCVLSGPAIEAPACQDWVEIPRIVKVVGRIGHGNCQGRSKVVRLSDGQIVQK